MKETLERRFAGVLVAAIFSTAYSVSSIAQGSPAAKISPSTP